MGNGEGPLCSPSLPSFLSLSDKGKGKDDLGEQEKWAVMDDGDKMEVIAENRRMYGRSSERKREISVGRDGSMMGMV